MNDTVEDYKALADDTRFEIIRLLLVHECCVGCLSNRLGVTMSAVSQHLKVLKQVGLVIPEKRGYYTHYMVDRNRLEQIGESIISLARTEPQMSDRSHMGQRQHACRTREDHRCISSKHKG
jgi:ArsR family transcriptional regulator, arsenate/arsenite/antimonite-responsive transcriptional repressor